MTFEQKQAHRWSCYLSRGHVQCNFVTRNGSDGFLHCCWQKGHPPDLPHTDSYNDPPWPDRRHWFAIPDEMIPKAPPVLIVIR